MRRATVHMKKNGKETADLIGFETIEDWRSWREKVIRNGYLITTVVWHDGVPAIDESWKGWR
jgi:hypothetical protein